MDDHTPTTHEQIHGEQIDRVYENGYENGLLTGAQAERERMIQILEHLGNHGVSHSERCLPRHWIVERAIEEITGENK